MRYSGPCSTVDHAVQCAAYSTGPGVPGRPSVALPLALGKVHAMVPHHWNRA